METNSEKLEQAHSLIARERVLGDLKTLARDAEDLLKATVGDVTDKAKELRARLTGTLERARVTCTELQGQTVASVKKADTVIRGHPYESIGVAFEVGLLIGVLVTRK